MTTFLGASYLLDLGDDIVATLKVSNAIGDSSTSPETVSPPTV